MKVWHLGDKADIEIKETLEKICHIMCCNYSDAQKVYRINLVLGAEDIIQYTDSTTLPK